MTIFFSKVLASVGLIIAVVPYAVLAYVGAEPGDGFPAFELYNIRYFLAGITLYLLGVFRLRSLQVKIQPTFLILVGIIVLAFLLMWSMTFLIENDMLGDGFGILVLPAFLVMVGSPLLTGVWLFVEIVRIVKAPVQNM